jgi:peptidoglycan hydrolase CwlO-like protein
MLRGQASVLDTRAHHALLDLYALDTRLQNTRTQLASLQAQSAQLRAQQALLSQQLSATQRTLQSSRKRLGENLRTLYEQGDSTDALAVVLGAKSLDEAVTTIDDLTRVADQSRQVVAATSAAQIRLDRLRSSIGVRRARLKAAVSAALQTASDLASAQSERRAFLTRLRTQQALKTQQIAALQAAVQRVEVKSQQLQSAAVASSATPTTPTDTTPAPTTPAAPTAAPASGGRTITVSSTGYSLPGHTATGMPVGWGVVGVAEEESAADWSCCDFTSTRWTAAWSAAICCVFSACCVRRRVRNPRRSDCAEARSLAVCSAAATAAFSRARLMPIAERSWSSRVCAALVAATTCRL